MENKPDNLGADEACVLQFLKNWPGDFVAEMEIARRADGKSRLLEEPRWAANALSRLMALKLVESDGNGKYRVRPASMVVCGGQKRFIAPHLLEILEKSGRHFDLSA